MEAIAGRRGFAKAAAGDAAAIAATSGMPNRL